MKAFFSILLASLILFLSTGFTIATHYCGGVAVSTSLSPHGVAEACGMEGDNNINCESDTPEASKRSCCDESIVNLEIDYNYQPADKQSIKLNLSFVQTFVHILIITAFGLTENVDFKEYPPPLVLHNILIENQVFLI